MNYENDIRIDETALDVEWLQQASLTFHYSKHAAHQRMLLEKEKERLQVLKAGLDKDIRNNPSDYDIEKVTETAISNTILTLPKYKEANMVYLEARYDSDMADAAVRSLQDKKSALENLVRLHGAQYFSGPSIPRELNKEWEKKALQTKVDTGVAKALLKRK